jgi:ribosomal protein L11 methyltransferase
LKEFYYELLVTPNNYYNLYLDLILSITCEALQESEGTIIIRSEKPLDIIEEAIVVFTKELQKIFDVFVVCKILKNKKNNIDWIKKYQESVQAISVGKFYIHPEWISKVDNKINILINPALAFGSGHHETTSTCLEAISRYVKKDDTFIDVGTGSGILAIAGSKLGAKCDICDTDPISIINAKENFKFNNTNFIDSWEGSALKSDKSYNVVVANIVADVLIMIKNDLKQVLKDDGILVISGILDKYENKVLKKYKEFKLVEKIQKNEWVTFILSKEENE